MSATHLSGPLYVSGGIMGGMMAPSRGRAWYVDTNAGGGDGSDWDNAFNSMASAFLKVGSNDTIFAVGNIREQLTAPDLVFDVRIIGCGNMPRNSDAVTGALSQRSCTWKGPVSPTATTPLLTLQHQGWQLSNILFNASSDSAAVRLRRNALADNLEDDASHAQFLGCRFVGGVNGIEDVGGHYNVLVDGCDFFNITDGTGRAIYCSSTAVANPLHWEIRNSKFWANDNHIIAAASGWYVHDNAFHTTGVTKAITFLGGVATNIVTRNYFGGTYDTTLYTVAGAGDEWGGNYNSISGGITAADPT